MKRLVYSPSVKVWIKTDFGVIDLSPYLTHCQIDRKIDDISKLKIAFRNPKVSDSDGKLRFMFTEKIKDDGTVGPVFHPMDPITVVMERIAGRPIQVFTGYCDKVPYVQLFPGVGTITASCTLKRLKHTYWDPALPFVAEFLKHYGWILRADGVAQSAASVVVTAQDKKLSELFNSGDQVKAVQQINLNDGSIGNLLYAVLQEIGGWDSSNIWIQPLPNNITSVVSKLMDEFIKDNRTNDQEISKFLSDLVGSGSFGSAASSGVDVNQASNNNTGDPNASVDPNSLPAGAGTFDGYPVAKWIIPILTWARNHGWTGTITSGYRTHAQNEAQGRYYHSNHEDLSYPGGAIDVGGWHDQAQGQALYDVIKNYPDSPTLVWGGPVISDWGHFSATGH